MTNWARTNISFVALVVSISFIVVYRVLNVHLNEISWDAFGYYLYLPSIFIHSDFFLSDISWIHEANEQYQLTDTLYQLSVSPSGEPLYFFLMGMSLFYLPFFLIAHSIAMAFGFEPDGFSAPYQYSMAIGCITYTIIGLAFLRKLLIKYFSDKVVGLTLLLIVFGTNAIHHLTIKNLETVNVLFMLAAFSAYCADEFYQSDKPRYLLTAAISSALMILVKPSEGVIVVLLVIWNAGSMSDLRQRGTKLLRHWKTLLIAALAVGLLAAPQALYWYTKTGHLIYDSYINPGVGLDFLAPHVSEVLFSFRKGWLVYTPLIAFGLIGLIWLTRLNPKLGLPISIYVFVELWVVSSWTEWWYGAAFSCRPMIITYPFIAFGLACFVERMFDFRAWKKFVLSGFIGLSVILNLFKYWQQEQGIIDPYRMTRQYYCATFFDTEWSGSKQPLLLVNRAFDGNSQFQFPHLYTAKEVLHIDSVVIEDEFYPILRVQYGDLSRKDHFWIELNYLTDSLNHNENCYVVFEMVRAEGSYAYQAKHLDLADIGHQTIRYLTPEIRSDRDIVHVYLWNRDRGNLEFKSIVLNILERSTNMAER